MVVVNLLRRLRTQLEDDLRKQLEERLRFETLLTDLATGFVGLPTDQVDGAIESAQRQIVEALGLDRSSLFQINADGELQLTHSAVRSGLQPFPAKILAREKFPWLLGKLMKGETIRISRHDDLPPEAAQDLATFREHGPKSTVGFPLRAGGPVFGGLAFGKLTEEVHWTDAMVARLRLVAILFANTLSRRRSEEEVRRLTEQLQQEKVYLQGEVESLHGHGEIVGSSQALRNVLAQAGRVAPTDATVLLTGETGTGKELLAKRIHELSRRKERTMIKVNCAALSPTLIEAELFGREKGAYTGALSRQAGRFELADGSTLFLDEVAELPLDLQAKLLRVLQDGQFERIGGTRTLKVDVRLIAASNRDLAKDAADGSFRSDLYYRLNAFPVLIPPLRERPDDIPALAWNFARQAGQTLGKPIKRIPQEVMSELQTYAWPGNVRELRNLIERAIILGDSSTLRLPPSALPVEPRPAASLTRDDVERAHVLEVLKRTRWRIRGGNGAAEILGLKPTTLEARMKKLGLQRPM
jgi:transcriptional regulator with GAF, ATPase, and Fis domain